MPAEEGSRCWDCPWPVRSARLSALPQDAPVVGAPSQRREENLQAAGTGAARILAPCALGRPPRRRPALLAFTGCSGGTPPDFPLFPRAAQDFCAFRAPLKPPRRQAPLPHAVVLACEVMVVPSSALSITSRTLPRLRRGPPVDSLPWRTAPAAVSAQRRDSDRGDAPAYRLSRRATDGLPVQSAQGVRRGGVPRRISGKSKVLSCGPALPGHLRVL